MVTWLTQSTRVALILVGTGSLAVWAGCSRLMTPPGQRLFGQHQAESKDWVPPAGLSADYASPDRNASLDRNASPDRSQPAMSPGAVTGPIGNSFQVSDETLDQRYAQSIKVPEKTPPRLIPIESVSFPGDGSEVVAASATLSDHPSSSTAMVAGFSDSVEDKPAGSSVKQAVVLSDMAPAESAPSKTAPAVPVPTQPDPALASSNPAASVSKPQSAPSTATPIAPPKETAAGLAKTSKPSENQQQTALAAAQLDYHRSVAQVADATKTSSFRPDAFQAARRASDKSPNLTQPSPSDQKPTAGFKPEVKTTVVRASSQAENPASKTPAAPVGQTDLAAAGIKVDANLFQISVPQQSQPKTKSPQSAKPAGKPQVSEVQPDVKPEVSLFKPGPPPANSQRVKPELRHSSSAETKTGTSEPSAGSQSSNASMKAEGSSLTLNATHFVTGNTTPPAKDTEAKEPARSLAAPTAQVSSDFAPLRTATPPVTAKTRADKPLGVLPVNPGKPVASESLAANFSPGSPSSASTGTTLATGKASEASSQSRPFGAPSSQFNIQPAARPRTVLSELNLIRDLFPQPFRLVPQGKKTSQPTQLSAPGAVPQVMKKLETPALPAPGAANLIPAHVEDLSPPSNNPLASRMASHDETHSTLASPELRLVNSQFCTEIKGFGQVTPFASLQFKGNQRTLVYCEVENFSSQTLSQNGSTRFVTRFRGDYQIVNQQGSLAQAGQFPEIEDVTERKRRDFYLYFPITFKQLPPGQYDLKLTIEESTAESQSLGSQRVAHRSLEFVVE